MSPASRAAVLGLIVVAVAVVDRVLQCFCRTSRLTRQVRELVELARTDTVTGMHNRRHVEEHLGMAVSAARRHHQPLSVLFVDVDGFKRINDELGYEVGDEVLRVVGDRMRSSLRAEDIVGRWGGEEFVAVLPTTELEGALAVAERVRTTIADTPIEVAHHVTGVTVSVGCVSGTCEPDEIIVEAGRALRQAKLAGKNRVVAAGAPAD